MSDATSAALAVELVQQLTARTETLAVAESLTGGLVQAAITDVAGASVALRGGVVAYATDLKHRLLGVDDAQLSLHGAVAADTAAQMALGVARLCGADWGLATTGVAGPDPQEGHPPGTVFIAVARHPDRTTVRQLALPGDRSAVRDATVRAVLGWLVDELARPIAAQ